MSKKEMKLETYLLYTNFLFGVFWILSGIIDLFDKLPMYAEIINLVALLGLLIIFLKGSFSQRENFDELSTKIKNSVDSNILCLSLPIILFVCEIFDWLKTLNILSEIPWHSVIKIIVGCLFCLQFIIFVAEMKKTIDFNGEDYA